MKNINIHYFVEGDNEKQLINVLRTELRVIRSGKVQKLNVINEPITDTMLRPLARNTVVVLVFDTDTDKVDVLNSNIAKLKAYSSVSEVITVPQVPDLEEELLRSCHVKRLADLFGSRSLKEHKRALLRITNLPAKLREHGFDIRLFWSTQPKEPYQHILNGADKIKLLD